MRNVKKANATLTCENGHVLWVDYDDVPPVKGKKGMRTGCHVCESKILTLKRTHSSKD